MCGRYFLETLPAPLGDAFHVSDPPDFEANWNVAPTQLMPIVVAAPDGRRMGPARWGLIPFWAKDEKIGYRMINARAETVAEKPAFRQAFAKRRCLVPASGFYEWMKVAGGKQPYAIRPRDEGLMAFAGLWERWKTPEDETLISYTIVTTNANETVRPVHDRMPAILAPADHDAWLEGTPEQAGALLAPAAEELLACYPVSKEVGSPRNNRPDLIEPIAL